MNSVGYTAGTSEATASAVTYPLQSWSLIFRDAMLGWLLGMPYFNGWTARRTKAFQVQPQHVPYIGLYFLRDTTSPDGDLNIGDIRFIHDVTYGFSIIVQNNDPDECEAKLDEVYCVIANTLWPNQYLMNLYDTRNPYQGGSGTPFNTRVEGIRNSNRRHSWGTLDNELPIGELQYEVTCVFREEFAPVIPDDLLEIHLQTGVKHDDTPEEMAKRLQAVAKYVFETQP